MRSCGGCRVCCWIYSIGELEKKPLNHCSHECAVGCAVWGTSAQPKECKDFQCPYLLGDNIHRPDTFQPILIELGGTLCNTIPWVPYELPVEEAFDLIRSSLSILTAFVVADGKWKVDALNIHQPQGDILSGTIESRNRWVKLLTSYGIEKPAGLE